MRRRTVVAGLAGLGATAAAPALAQAIRRQSDPYAQVDPYDDPRNGFRTEREAPHVADDRPHFAETGPNSAQYATDEIEIAMAEKDLAKDIEAFGGLMPDRVQQAIRQFAAPLIRVADRRTLPWEAFVPRKDEVNAFAGPGGKLWFLPELIRLCDQPIHLAAVVAHEIGHVDHRHSFEAMEAARMLGERAKASGMAGAIEKNSKVLGVSLVTVLMLGHGRENEFEADAHILKIFQRAGLDPAGADDVFRRMLVAFRENPDAETSLFSTHPGTMERIKAIESEAAHYPRPKGSITLPGWDVLKAAFPTPAKWKNI